MMDISSQLSGWVRPDERRFVRRALDWCQSVHADSVWKLTDFLTPREHFLLDSVVRNQGLVMSSYGGPGEPERVRVLVMPDDWYPEPADFHTHILQVTAMGGGVLSHGSVLGSLLGTGLERRKVGDIVVAPGGVYVSVCSEITPFLQREWTSVGREPVHIEPAETDILIHGPEYQPEIVSLASLRADALLAHACRWSRSNAQEAIKRGHVTLNFVPLERADETLETGDLLSVRGFGRIKIHSVLGESKKGRLRVQVGVLRSSRS